MLRLQPHTEVPSHMQATWVIVLALAVTVMWSSAPAVQVIARPSYFYVDVDPLGAGPSTPTFTEGQTTQRLSTEVKAGLAVGLFVVIVGVGLGIGAPHQGYGFLEASGGLDIYFHENSLVGTGFADLAKPRQTSR